MRVLSIVSGLKVGGAEIALVRLLAATRRNFDHSVISLTAGDELAPRLRDLGIPVVEAGFRQASIPMRGLPRFFRAVSAFQPDILVGQMYHGALAATIARQLQMRDKPLVWHFHYTADQIGDDPFTTRFAFGGCRAFRRCPDRVVFVSKASASQHIAMGFRAEKAALIPNGVDFAQIRFDAAGRERLRAQWGFGQDDFVIGHVARVHPIKDHATMIQALVTAHERRQNIAAVFSGPGTESLAIPDVIAGRVRLLGSRSDVPAIMSACDAGGLSSVTEAFPNVVVEFLACERLFIATDVGDVSAIIGDFGLVVPPSNVPALADAITKMAALPEAERKARGAQARQHLRTSLEIDVIAAQHARLWHSLVDGALMAR